VLIDKLDPVDVDRLYGRLRKSGLSPLTVVNKVTVPLFAVTDERAARGVPFPDLDRLYVGAVGTEALEVEPAEVIVTNAADDAACCPRPSP